MLYEQCIWRLKCFLSIQVKKYLVYLFLASWEWFLQTSALQSASTEERLSGDFLLIKSCVYEFFGVDKKWPYETKNRYIGYFMNKIDRKHIVLQVKTKNLIRFPPLEKLLSLKVMKPSKTAVKTADRSYHFKRHCTFETSRLYLVGLLFPPVFRNPGVRGFSRVKINPPGKPRGFPVCYLISNVELLQLSNVFILSLIKVTQKDKWI